MSRRRGRPIRPVPDPEHGIGLLALTLRRGRARSGLTRLQLAARIDCSVATIQRAEAGKTLPTWSVTQGYALSCGLDATELETLWKAARRPLRGVRLTPAPRLNLVRTSADLAAALVRVHEENDQPSLRKMQDRAEQRAKDFAPLSRMSAWRIVNRQLVPSSVRQLHAYLTACEVPEETFPAWAQAWHRVQRYEKSLAKNRRSSSRAAKKSQRTTAAEAKAIMAAAGLKPLDGYPGQHAPWAAQCTGCGQLSRFRLTAVRQGRGCPVCTVRSDRTAA